jgi:hypothetical protein
MNVLFIEQKWSQGEKGKTITTTRYDILATKKERTTSEIIFSLKKEIGFFE